MQKVASDHGFGSTIPIPRLSKGTGMGLEADERRDDQVATPVPEPRGPLAHLAASAQVRRMIGVALACLVLGSILGYTVGMVTAPHPPPPGPAVARYMAGLQRMDGAEMWASMSPEMQAHAIRNGDSPAKFAAFYEHLKTSGGRIDQVLYVGGYQTKEKGIFTFVTRRFDPNKETIEIVWLMVTGPEGLIEYVI